MKRGPKLTPVQRQASPTPVVIMVLWMKRLPRRHCIAHLRALIRRQPPGSVRRKQLAALLRDETTVQPGKESRAK